METKMSLDRIYSTKGKQPGTKNAEHEEFDLIKQIAPSKLVWREFVFVMEENSNVNGKFLKIQFCCPI